MVSDKVLGITFSLKPPNSYFEGREKEGRGTWACLFFVEARTLTLAELHAIFDVRIRLKNR